MQPINSGVIILVFSVVVAVISILLLVLNRSINYLINRHRLASRKTELQFECGLNPTAGPASRLSISYFLIAAAFLIFELEGAILLPWAVDYWKLGMPGVVTAVVFIIVLLLGLVYMLAKGALKL